VSIEFENTLAEAVPELVVEWNGAEVPDSSVVVFNTTLAAELGLESLASAPELLTGTAAPSGAQPVAMVYAGHQFGQYNPRLGDGRALLLGEIVDRAGGRRFDLHLKGSGRTPFARGGDGKAALGPMLREYLVSESMNALGVPTTRSLAVTTTGEYVHREGDRTGAVLARIAASHLRVGTFEYAARLPDRDALRRLADHTITRHHPAAATADQPYLALLDGVIGAQADLVAQWMLVGFVHGVMNTDNMAVSGETIDYGPCAFMDRFDPDTVFSSIDHAGRYRYSHQPGIAQWNLARLAECLLQLMTDDPDGSLAAATALIDGYPDRYRRAWTAGMASKLGLVTPTDADVELFDELLAVMQSARLDYTTTFRQLASTLRGSGEPGTALAEWHRRWLARLAVERDDLAAVADTMDRINPLYVPRNHLVEEALDAAATGDLDPFRALLDAVVNPFDAREQLDRYAQPAPDEFARCYQTFCGT
jgi:uncharacterized protein YdiU (UPF0061 family)